MKVTYNKTAWCLITQLPAFLLFIVWMTFSSPTGRPQFSAAAAVESFWSPSTWGAVAVQEAAQSAANDSYLAAVTTAMGLTRSAIGWSALGLGLAGLVAGAHILALSKAYAPAAVAAVATPAAATPAGAGISFTPPVVVAVEEPVVAKVKVIGRPKGAVNKNPAAWTATKPKQRSPGWTAPKQKPPVGQPVGV